IKHDARNANKKMSSEEEQQGSEVFKHMDAKTLAMFSCVSKIWYRTPEDERLWEPICTRQWANIGYSQDLFKSVVLKLGRFRRLHKYCCIFTRI
ncbi:hypothetical protein EUTSA_v10000501mg, partial [Eutrema salsugineum]